MAERIRAKSSFKTKSLNRKINMQKGWYEHRNMQCIGTQILYKERHIYIVDDLDDNSVQQECLHDRQYT
jgi:hypothetical protein